MRLGAHERAEADLREALELSPKDRRLRAWLGLALLRLGREEQALSEFESSLDRPEPALAPVFLERGELHVRLGRIPAAQSDFRMAFMLAPRSPEGLKARDRLGSLA